MYGFFSFLVQAQKFYVLNEQVAEAAALANLERKDGNKKSTAEKSGLGAYFR